MPILKKIKKAPKANQSIHIQTLQAKNKTKTKKQNGEHGEGGKQ